MPTPRTLLESPMVDLVRGLAPHAFRAPGRVCERRQETACPSTTMRARTISLIVEALVEVAAASAGKLRRKRSATTVDSTIAEAVVNAINAADNVTPTMLDAVVEALEARIVRWIVGTAVVSVCVAVVLLWLLLRLV